MFANRCNGRQVVPARGMAGTGCGGCSGLASPRSAPVTLLLAPPAVIMELDVSCRKRTSRPGSWRCCGRRAGTKAPGQRPFGARYGAIKSIPPRCGRWIKGAPAKARRPRGCGGIRAGGAGVRPELTGCCRAGSAPEPTRIRFFLARGNCVRNGSVSSSEQQRTRSTDLYIL